MSYILKKRIKGSSYYYLAETQHVNGKPRIVWQKYLGTADKIKQKLLEAKEEEIVEVAIFELGSVAAIEALEKELRFQAIVDEVVPKRSQGMRVGQYLYLIVLSRAIQRTKKKLQELRCKLKTADRRTTLRSVERRVKEILSESHIAPVFSAKVSRSYGKYKLSTGTDPLMIKEYRARFGKNILFTDHLDWSNEEIILAYREKYKIESAFKLTKDPFLVRWTPMYCWTDSKIRVHGLTCVMALLFLCLLRKRLKETSPTISLDKAMEVLRGIRLAHCYYPWKSQPVRKVCRLSSTEEELLKSLNIDLVSQLGSTIR